MRSLDRSLATPCAGNLYCEVWRSEIDGSKIIILFSHSIYCRTVDQPKKTEFVSFVKALLN